MTKTVSTRQLNSNLISANIGYLKLIADQNGLRLNRPREFKICREILNRSINTN